jgi:hypothetical protein
VVGQLTGWNTIIGLYFYNTAVTFTKEAVTEHFYLFKG